jgi:hypothetical protein
LVFWVALIPGFASIVVLFVGVKEPARSYSDDGWRIRRGDVVLLTAPFWWAISIAAIFSLARFSPAFLVLKAHDVHVDAALVPFVLVVMYLAYCAASYPFGILADRMNRRVQLGIGAIILIGADLALAGAETVCGRFPVGPAEGRHAGASFGRHCGCRSGAAARHGIRNLRFGGRSYHVCRQRPRRLALDARRPRQCLHRGRLARSSGDRPAVASAHAEAWDALTWSVMTSLRIVSPL